VLLELKAKGYHVPLYVRNPAFSPVEKAFKAAHLVAALTPTEVNSHSQINP